VLTGVNALTVTSPDPDLWTVARTRQSKFQENTLLTNQTNITANLTSGAVSHAITGGFEFIDEEQFNPTYAPLSLGVAPPANVYNPNRNDPLPDYAPVRNGVYTRGETQTFGAYLFDTLTVNENRQAIAGFRLDSYDEFRRRRARRYHHPTARGRWCRRRPDDDILFSYKVGVVSAGQGTAASTFECHLAAASGRRELRAEHGGNNANRPRPQRARTSSSARVWDLRGSLALNAAIYPARAKRADSGSGRPNSTSDR
jgi:catecholate siderophore receptor